MTNTNYCLTVAENTDVQNICEMARFARENFGANRLISCFTEEGGQDFVLIADDNENLAAAAKLLTDREIARLVTRSRIMYDEDFDEVVPFCDGDDLVTVIQDGDNEYSFEAGFTYIRLLEVR